jgi:nucleoside-diphosphate-sugar epimerase
MSQKVALVVGSTGIVGLTLANHLAQQSDWTVYGLARRAVAAEGVRPIVADLLKPESLNLL